MATKKEIAEKKDFEAWIKEFKDKSEEEAKEFIATNVYDRKISKGLIAAYLATYHKKDDNTWFKKASIVKKQQTALTIATDATGKPIYKTNKKGEVIPKKVRVAVAGASIEGYDHNKAKKAFIKHFDIKVKATTFEAKPKRDYEKEPVFDAFAGLF